MQNGNIHQQVLARSVGEFVAKGVRRFLVTSAGAGEGKTTVVADLGRALAAAGQAGVVVIDADAYKPTLHLQFGLGVENGLGDLLAAMYGVDVTSVDPAQFGIGDWLELLQAQQRTGELRVNDSTRAFTLHFRKGALCSIAQAAVADPHRLGELLVGSGRISAAQRARALAVQLETGRALGDVLCTLGAIGEGDLAPVLQAQVQHRLQELLGVRQARCEFTELAEAHLAVAAGRVRPLPESGCVEALVTADVRSCLGDPFLASQLPSYLHDTEAPNLKLLTGGSRPYDLMSPRQAVPFELLLERLARVFDVVVVDVPPASLLTPTASLAGAVDGVVMVVRSGHFETAAIQRAIGQMRRSGARIVGVVLTDVDLPGESALSPYYRVPASARGPLAGVRS